MDIQDLLSIMVQRKASDLHITSGAAPTLRIDGEMIPMSEDKLKPEQTQALIYSLLSDTQKQRFEATNELDFSLYVRSAGRVRVNIYRQRGSIGMAIRSIPPNIPTIDELGLPEIIYQILRLPKGLVLLTGPTGAGKSTSLAAMIDYLNENTAAHIITIEDPIEFVHWHKRSLVNQREVGSDTQSFAQALKYVLRQDPNVILIGEMRDLETISAALTVAETGHLVFATLHTVDAAQTINRIIDVFPPHQQSQIRAQLSFVLEAVFSQQLLHHAKGTGRVLASEVLIATPAIRNLVREQKIEQIPMTMQTGTKFGMQTMNMALASLIGRRLITPEEAMAHTTDPTDLRRLMQLGPNQPSGIPQGGAGRI